MINQQKNEDYSKLKINIILLNIISCLKKYYLEEFNFNSHKLEDILLQIYYEHDILMIEDIIFNLDKHKNIRKIESDGTYIYNPPIDIKTKQDLEKLLSEKFLSNGSGLFLEDIIESLPSSAQVLKDLESEDKIIIIGGIKKRKSVFSKQIYSKYKIPNIEKIIKEEYYE